MFEAVTIICDTLFPVWYQRGSNEIYTYIGTAIFEHERCKCERGNLGGGGGGAGELWKIWKSWYCLVASNESFGDFYCADRTV